VHNADVELFTAPSALLALDNKGNNPVAFNFLDRYHKPAYYYLLLLPGDSPDLL
jgi:hypothetical protein